MFQLAAAAEKRSAASLFLPPLGILGDRMTCLYEGGK